MRTTARYSRNPTGENSNVMLPRTYSIIRILLDSTMMSKYCEHADIWINFLHNPGVLRSHKTKLGSESSLHPHSLKMLWLRGSVNIGYRL